MNLTRADFRKLALPGIVCLALLLAGAGLIWGAREAQRGAQQALAAAQAERAKRAEQLARIAEEEREVSEKLAVYQQLKRLNILGEERRLEWADAKSPAYADGSFEAVISNPPGRFTALNSNESYVTGANETVAVDGGHEKKVGCPASTSRCRIAEDGANLEAPGTAFDFRQRRP